MKILYCVSQLAARGGAERIVITKANAFIAMGHEVYIMIEDQHGCPIAYDDLSPQVKVIDMKVSSSTPHPVIPIITFSQMVKRLKKIYQAAIRKITPDVICVTERGYGDFIIPYICKDIPRIREFHLSREAALIKEQATSNTLLRWRSMYQNRLVYSKFNQYNCVVLLTNRDKEHSHYTTPTAVIPNFIPSLPGTCSDLESKTVISVGRLDRNKNFKDQILAWKSVHDKHPAWQLHIYGEGPERDSLQQLIDANGFQDSIFLQGNTPHIDKAYQTASFMLFTSRAEGFGMVLVEAMSYGLPCISYDTPCGPSEIIDNGINGYLIDMDDVASLSQKINDLIDNDDLRHQIGRAAREKAKAFTRDAIMPKWIELFESLTQRQA